MRAVLQIVLFVFGIGVIALLARGLGPVFPAAAAVLRGLLHPVTIVLALGLLLLIRAGRSRSTPSEGRRDDTRP